MGVTTKGFHVLEQAYSHFGRELKKGIPENRRLCTSGPFSPSGSQEKIPN